MKKIFLVTTYLLIGFMLITPALALTASMSYGGLEDYIDCSSDETGFYYLGTYDINEDRIGAGATELFEPGLKTNCFHASVAGASADGNYYGVFSTQAQNELLTLDEAQAHESTLGTATYTITTNIISDFVYTSAPEDVPILTVPAGGASDALGYVGQLFTDVWVLVAVAIGIPLAFYVIKRSINLVKR